MSVLIEESNKNFYKTSNMCSACSRYIIEMTLIKDKRSFMDTVHQLLQLFSLTRGYIEKENIKRNYPYM